MARSTAIQGHGKLFLCQSQCGFLGLLLLLLLRAILMFGCSNTIYHYTIHQVAFASGDTQFPVESAKAADVHVQSLYHIRLQTLWKSPEAMVELDILTAPGSNNNDHSSYHDDSEEEEEIEEETEDGSEEESEEIRQL